jgi:hypothetical protein
MKVTKEELDELLDIQKKYQERFLKIGELTSKISELDDSIAMMESQKGEYLDVYKDIMSKDRDIAKRLIDKYGPGTIDPNTGEIT